MTNHIRRARRGAPGAVASAALLGLGLGLALPASAPAALATSVLSTSVAGPNAAMSEAGTGASCTGRPVSGGGARMDQSVLSNGVHLVGSLPSPGGVGPSSAGDLSPDTWIGVGGIGGQAASGVTTWAYSVCLDAGPAATQIAATSTRGPAGTFSGTLSTATCPAGTQLLSGGARTTPGTVGSLKPNGSFPSDANGAPVVGGGAPTSWTAAGLNGGAGDAGNTTHAFAVCAAAGAANPVVTVHNARVDGPNAASTGAQVTASCPAGAVLVGGGAYISDRFALPGSQGDHLTGSFPSTANGDPVTAGPAGSWTASSHTGGTVSGPLTDTNAWAMCATEAPPVPDGGGAAVPAPAQPPVVAPAGPVAGGVAIAQIREGMRRQMTPKGSAAKLSVLLRRGGARLAFRSPEAGRLLVRWQTATATVRGKRLKPILVAQGRTTFTRSGQRTVVMRLTAAGRRVLRGARRVRLTARGEFVRRGRRTPIVGLKGFVLTRNAASSTL